MPKPKLYVDACCIIESLKGDVGAEDPARRGGLDMLKRILQAGRDDKLLVFTSLFTVAEVVKSGNAPITDDIKKKIERMIMSGRDGMQTIGLSPLIVIKARDLAWNDGLAAVKPADRIHIASAIAAEAKEFISWDNRLGKKINKENIAGLRLIEPSATNLLPVEYRTDDMFKG